jgi:hypothetical protein
MRRREARGCASCRDIADGVADVDPLGNLLSRLSTWDQLSTWDRRRVPSVMLRIGRKAPSFEATSALDKNMSEISLWPEQSAALRLTLKKPSRCSDVRRGSVSPSSGQALYMLPTAPSTR